MQGIICLCLKFQWEPTAWNNVYWVHLKPTERKSNIYLLTCGYLSIYAVVMGENHILEILDNEGKILKQDYKVGDRAGDREGVWMCGSYAFHKLG